MKTNLKYDKIDLLLNTEKSNNQMSIRKYTFIVDKKLKKRDIISIIEKTYSVEIEKLNTLNFQPKQKKFKGVLSRKKIIKKKVILTVKEGQSIKLD